MVRAYDSWSRVSSMSAACIGCRAARPFMAMKADTIVMKIFLNIVKSFFILLRVTRIVDCYVECIIRYLAVSVFCTSFTCHQYQCFFETSRYFNVDHNPLPSAMHFRSSEFSCPSISNDSGRSSISKINCRSCPGVSTLIVVVLAPKALTDNRLTICISRKVSLRIMIWINYLCVLHQKKICCQMYGKRSTFTPPIVK